jgi:omega-6 fatty acid desaturase (delta-12 desaturase)
VKAKYDDIRLLEEGYEAWVLGHNRIHHGHTLREGMDFVWHPLTVVQYRSFSRWQRARHRLEWSRLGAGSYYLREVWWNKMITFTPPERYRAAIRRDTRFVAVAAAIATVTVGTAGWVTDGPIGAVWLVTKLLVVPFLAFCWFIGFTVYVHHIAPDLAWWPRRRWTSFAGQVEGTTVLHTPRILNSLFFHNIFVHVPHHVDARIPFHQLPRAADHIAASYPGTVRTTRWSMRDYVRATRTCKLYDFEAGRWLPYRQLESPGRGNDFAG